KEPENRSPRDNPLQVIENKGAKFVACVPKTDDQDQCASCMNKLCSKPMKIYAHSKNYLACEIKKSKPENDEKEKKPKKSNHLWHWKEGPNCPIRLDCSQPAEEPQKVVPEPPPEDYCHLLKSNLPTQFTQKDINIIRKRVLLETNKYRKAHCACFLEMRKKLNNHAQEWATYLAAHDLLETRFYPDYGESIVRVRREAFNVDRIIQLWYQEKYTYDYLKPEFNPYNGHFTQMIWQDTEHMGVGVASKLIMFPPSISISSIRICIFFSQTHIWIVCNFQPPGNITNQFKENVLPRKMYLTESDLESIEETMKKPCSAE
ncbi:hypothetical protein KR018_011059, partial [Drosophila ironensis]